MSAGQRIAAIYTEKKFELAKEFGSESKWTFSEEFQKIWLYNVYGFAIKKLVIREEKRRKEESVSIYLENNKSALQEDFMRHCQQSLDSLSVMNDLCNDVLKPSIYYEVRRTFGDVMVNDILMMKTMTNKRHFLLEIHKDLLDEDTEATTIRMFSSEYELFATDWIEKKVLKESINEKWFEKKLEDFLASKAKELQRIAEHTANECIKDEIFKPTEWWQRLKDNIDDKILLQVMCITYFHLMGGSDH